MTLAHLRRIRLRGLGRRHADRLTRLDVIARFRTRAVEPKLPGARPFGDGGEAGVGQMPLEPAIEPDAVIVRTDAEGADIVFVFGVLGLRGLVFGRIVHATALTR
jgi:hypothetical protein